MRTSAVTVSTVPGRSRLSDSWPSLDLLLIFGLVIIRLTFMTFSELMPEEAYYWNYGQHLDWGYLDHPPMVAWLSRLGTTIFGHTEFGVRFFALVAWLTMSLYSYRLTRELFNRRAAQCLILMLAVLPFYYSIGTLMMPDPLVSACWAATLFYLQRALLEKRGKAWYGVGIALGVGLLSKYTIGLLVPATLLFMLVDRDARGWFADRMPYIAIAIALLFFTPVIYWNSQHEWVSFAFQTTRRLSSRPEFSLHLLLGAIIVLLSPTIVWATAAALKKITTGNTRESIGWQVSRTRFILIMTFVPFSVFALFSISHEPKLNWTGPLWLALLPAVAWYLSDMASAAFRKVWRATATLLAGAYAIAVYWLIVGIPGLPYPEGMKFIVGWSQLEKTIAAAEIQNVASTGRKPLVTGTDRYFISSELAFYDKDDGPAESAGRNLFGGIALMYRFWRPEDLQLGKDVIIVGNSLAELRTPAIKSSFETLEPIKNVTITHNGQPICRYYYRTGHSYKGISRLSIT